MAEEAPAATSPAEAAEAPPVTIPAEATEAPAEIMAEVVAEAPATIPAEAATEAPTESKAEEASPATISAEATEALTQSKTEEVPPATISAEATEALTESKTEETPPATIPAEATETPKEPLVEEEAAQALGNEALDDMKLDGNTEAAETATAEAAAIAPEKVTESAVETVPATAADAATATELAEPSAETAVQIIQIEASQTMIDRMVTPRTMNEYHKSPLKHVLTDPVGPLSPRRPGPQQDLKTLQEVIQPQTSSMAVVQDEVAPQVKAQDGSRPRQGGKSQSVFSHEGCWIRPSAIAPKLRAQGLRDQRLWAAQQGPKDRAGRYIDHLKNVEGLPEGEEEVKCVADALGTLSIPRLTPLVPKNTSSTATPDQGPDLGKLLESLVIERQSSKHTEPEAWKAPLKQEDLKNTDDTSTTCGAESTRDDASEMSRTMMGDPSLASLPSLKSLKSLPESQGGVGIAEETNPENEQGMFMVGPETHSGYHPMMQTMPNFRQPKPGHPSLVSNTYMTGLYGTKTPRPYGSSARSPWQPGGSHGTGSRGLSTLGGAGASVVGSSKGVQDKRFGTNYSARSDPGASRKARAAAAAITGHDDEDLPNNVFQGERFAGYKYAPRRMETPKNVECPFSGRAIEDDVILKCGHRFDLKHLELAINGSKARSCGQGEVIICPCCGDIHEYTATYDETAKRSGLMGVYSDSKKAFLGDHLEKRKDFPARCNLPCPGPLPKVDGQYSSGVSIAAPPALPAMLRGALV